MIEKSYRLDCSNFGSITLNFRGEQFIPFSVLYTLQGVLKDPGGGKLDE